MTLPENAFPAGNLHYGRNYQIISKISIHENVLVDHYFKHDGKLLNWVISDRKGKPIVVNPDDCEWLSQTFFRNEDTLYGFSLIEKGSSTKLFLTPVKGKVDFSTFEPLGENYAKDKNRYYYGPGGKVIKENHLELFADETYKEEWYKLYPEKKTDQSLLLWKSKIVTAGEKVYWKGTLAKGVDSSLKRINYSLFADSCNAYEYNLQRIKKIEGVDVSSLVFCNFIKNGAIKGLASDKFKPIYRYTRNEALEKGYDFKEHKPLFHERKDELGPDYWWYHLEG